MLGWDRRLESWIAGHRVVALDPVFRWLTYIGTQGAVWLAIAAVVAVLSRRWQVLLWVAVADAAAQVSTTLIKAAVPRARPSVHTLVAQPHSHSFPSGHAASSFACAFVLASFAPRLRWPLYALAALITFSRAYVGVHYPFDVLAGALWGLLLGEGVLALKRLAEQRRRSRTWRGRSPS
jgi:undecaprenyl-diphosphatase